MTFTDQERYFVSESTVYRVLKAHDLINSPAFIVFKAASEFKDKTTATKFMLFTSHVYSATTDPATSRATLLTG